MGLVMMVCAQVMGNLSDRENCYLLAQIDRGRLHSFINLEIVLCLILWF